MDQDFSLDSKVQLEYQNRFKKFKVKRSSMKDLVQAFYEVAMLNKNKLEILMKGNPLLI